MINPYVFELFVSIFHTLGQKWRKNVTIYANCKK